MDGIRARALIPLLRIFFNLLYHQFAWAYNLISWIVSIGMWNDWIKSIIPDLSGDQILELGHGTGHLQLALLQAGKQVTGIDLSPQMGRISAKRIRKNHRHPHLVNGNAQYLPFPDDTFDQIVSTFPTQYITAHETIIEMHRVLRPGGDFILLPVAWITGGNILHKAAAWLFKITGQAPTIGENTIANELEHFTRAGFKSFSELRELHNSKVMLIRGTKII